MSSPLTARGDSGLATVVGTALIVGERDKLERLQPQASAGREVPRIDYPRASLTTERIFASTSAAFTKNGVLTH